MLLGTGKAPASYLDKVFDSVAWNGNSTGGRNIAMTLDQTDGAMSWIKCRSHGEDHILVDSVRGANNYLSSNDNGASTNDGSCVGGFTGSGLTINGNNRVNASSREYVSWNFVPKKNFFAIATWTGDGTNGRAISHSLGSVPGFIIMKRTDQAREWTCQHRYNYSYHYHLDLTNSYGSGNNYFSADPTATNFYVKNTDWSNDSGGTYVAYIFAHEAGGFGPNGDAEVISCGSYTGTGSSGQSGPKITLPFEPAFIMVKRSDAAGTWWMSDTLIGAGSAYTNVKTQLIRANQNNVETNGDTTFEIMPDGFRVTATDNEYNANNGTYIYMAIAADSGTNIEEPTTGSSVFNLNYGTSSGTIPTVSSGFPVEFAVNKSKQYTGNWHVAARKAWHRYSKLGTNATSYFDNDTNMCFEDNTGYGRNIGTNHLNYMWRRYAGFETICYHAKDSYNTVDSGAGRLLKHNLGRVPEMIWTKRIDGTGSWTVGHKGLNGGSSPWSYYIDLCDTNSQTNDAGPWYNTAPTATHFTIGQSRTNANNQDFLACLFASVDGISKVGTYAGSNSTQSINCGFQPRFLFIKNMNDADNWIVVDTTRGWGSGDDQRFFFNNNSPNSAHDVGAPTSTGFDMVGNVRQYNQAGRYYLFYAHA